VTSVPERAVPRWIPIAVLAVALAIAVAAIYFIRIRDTTSVRGRARTGG